MEGRKQDEIKYTTNGNIAALDGAGTCLAGWIGVVVSLYVSPESLTLTRIIVLRKTSTLNMRFYIPLANSINTSRALPPLRALKVFCFK